MAVVPASRWESHSSRIRTAGSGISAVASAVSTCSPPESVTRSRSRRWDIPTFSAILLTFRDISSHGMWRNRRGEANSSYTERKSAFLLGNSCTHPIGISPGVLPSTRTHPLKGSSIPARSLKSVVFPLPFGPVTTVCPAGISHSAISSTPCRSPRMEITGHHPASHQVYIPYSCPPCERCGQ